MLRQTTKGSIVSVGLLSIWGSCYPALADGGWSDGKNYFVDWNCHSQVGFNTINKLNIAPLGTHPPNLWKDSTFMGAYDSWSGGNPIIYFTWGNRSPGPSDPVFTEAYAAFNSVESKWQIMNYLDDRLPGGGVSSHDGSFSDSVFNEYQTPGWGPFANKPGNRSAIPGVSDQHVHFIEPYAGRETIGYPLTGTGPVGITEVQSKIQNMGADNNTRTCLHMNPTLYTDARGRRSMLVYLFTAGPPPTGRADCTLPDGRKLTNGNHVYRYEGPRLGWQLDVDRGVVGLPGNDAMNSVSGTPNEFVATQYGSEGTLIKHRMINSDQYGIGTSSAKIQIVDADVDTATDVLSCDAKGLHFAEASGNHERIYFLGDYINEHQVVVTHDIFVTYRTNLEGAQRQQNRP